MTTYGDSTYYGVILSTDVTSDAPSGDIVYMLSVKNEGNYTSENKIKKYAGGLSFSDKTGKREKGITISDIRIIPYSTYDSTQAFNNIVYFLQQRTKMSASPAYIWMINFNDNSPTGRYVQFGTNSAVSAQYNYVKGYVKSFRWKLEKNMYYISSLEFDECLN